MIKIKKFNHILIVNNLSQINEVTEYLKSNNILILGYLIQKIFFFKKDFDLKKIKVNNIENALKKRIINFYKNNMSFLLLIKKIIIKFILLLKKNGDN
jgi:hypothetical protein